MPISKTQSGFTGQSLRTEQCMRSDNEKSMLSVKQCLFSSVTPVRDPNDGKLLSDLVHHICGLGISMGTYRDCFEDACNLGVSFESHLIHLIPHFIEYLNSNNIENYPYNCVQRISELIYMTEGEICLSLEHCWAEIPNAFKWQLENEMRIYNKHKPFDGRL